MRAARSRPLSGDGVITLEVSRAGRDGYHGRTDTFLGTLKLGFGRRDVCGRYAVTVTRLREV